MDQEKRDKGEHWKTAGRYACILIISLKRLIQTTLLTRLIYCNRSVQMSRYNSPASTNVHVMSEISANMSQFLQVRLHPHHPFSS